MLIDFYLRKSTDCNGRKLEEIWMWGDGDWEFEHDYIQWFFPTFEASMFNADAPILTQEIVDEFHKNHKLQSNLRLSYECFLKFCGIIRDEGKIKIKDDFKGSVWGEFNHKWLRMTRVLKSLMTLGLQKEAKEFFELLKEFKESRHAMVSQNTFSFWENAINKS